ncbi:MAG: hypothetical protein V4754_16235 [Pseudomonadota bacterium]
MKNRQICQLAKVRKFFANSSFFVMLAGCATAPTTPPQRVEVPVYVPCVTGARLPAPVFEFGMLQATANDGDKILALARDWPRGRAYEIKLEAIIQGCR